MNIFYFIPIQLQERAAAHVFHAFLESKVEQINKISKLLTNCFDIQVKRVIEVMMAYRVNREKKETGVRLDPWA
jgi:hypothetical protein